jgi:hypothetical protein
MALQFDHADCLNVYQCCSISITKSNGTYIISITVMNTGTSPDNAWFTLWYQEPCTPPAPPPFNSNDKKALNTVDTAGIGNGTNNVGPVPVPAGESVTTWVAWSPDPDVYDDTSILVQVADQPNAKAGLAPGSPYNALQLVSCADPVPAALYTAGVRATQAAVALPPGAGPTAHLFAVAAIQAIANAALALGPAAPPQPGPKGRNGVVQVTKALR